MCCTQPVFLLSIIGIGNDQLAGKQAGLTG
jgi:hypothetical protein